MAVNITNAKRVIFHPISAAVVLMLISGCASTKVPFGGAGCADAGAACATPGCGDGSAPVPYNVSGMTAPGCNAPAVSGPACNAPMMAMGNACGPAGCGTEGCGTPGCGIQPCGMTGVIDGSCMNANCMVPRELNKVTLPDYRIEPPDVLLIEAANNLRTAHDPILAGEVVIIQANRTIPIGEDDSPIDRAFKTIDGPYVIGTDGYINLGPDYGKVLAAGQPIAEIQKRVEVHLKKILTNPKVMVTLPDPSAKQIVAGQHLVRPDGTVGLGIYGSIRVAGLTRQQAKAAIERHLASHMHNPQIYVDVLGYNSKKFYIITDGGGAGEQVAQMPSTGNETVLDAIAQINGLPTVANRGRIWIARPNPNPCGADQILHVDWDSIARGGQTATNYQIFPGDRLYVKADRWIAFDTQLAKITAPLERILGFAILGNGAVRTLQQGGNAFGGGGGF